MRKKTIELEVNYGGIGSLGVGSHIESDWIVEVITFVGMDEYGIKIIADCIHVEDYQ